MTYLENEIASNFLTSDINEYNQIAKSKGLNDFKAIVKEAAEAAQEFSQSHENMVADAVEIVEGSMSEYIEF